MNSLLLWIGGLLVAVLGLLFAVPHLIDWNTYRGVFEEEATRILGRDVRVGGKVNLRLLPTPFVRFEKVRISDAGAALGEPFFRAEAFTLWLSPTPLLRGAIEANEVELDQPVLRLAVDGGGNGNWQQLKITPGSLPFVPSDVVLQQVRIRNGIVSLRTPSTPEPLTLSGIDGELAASSLDGPYRFRGNVAWSGVTREVRFTTSPREPDGKVRYKAAIRAVDSANVYALDGLLTELSAKARHTGVLTARLPIGEGAGAGRSARGGDIVDLKANIEGDIDGLRLSDVQLGFEHDGKPQLMSGNATATWRNGLRTETRLASRWIDLDQIAGSGGGAAPMARVRSVIDQVGALMPADGASVLTIDVDQVNVGGEALSNVRLAMARAGGLTSIGELRAGLPGNARGEVRGTFVATPAQGGGAGRRGDPFEGEIVLHGGSYRRFLSWAGAAGLLEGGDAGATGARPDGGFSLASRVRLSPDRLELSNATLEIGERHHTGGLDWRWGGERALQIAVEGQMVDIAPLAAGALDLASVRAGPGGSVPLADTGSLLLSTLATRAAAVERAVGRLAVKLRANALTDGAATLNDVEADFVLAGDRLEIARLKFASTSAARVDLRGALTALTSRPQGTVRGWIGAGSRQGFAGVADLLPSGAQAVGAGWLNRIADADLGFVLTLSGGETGRASIQANGLIEGARVAVDLKLDGGLGRWREAPIDLTMSLEGAAAAGIARRMAGIGAVAEADGARATRPPAALHLKAVGASAASLTTRASLDTSDTRVAFDGRTVVEPLGGGLALTGDLTIDAKEAADLLVLAGAPRRPSTSGAPVRGTLAVERRSGTTRLSGTGLAVAGSVVGGEVVVADKGERMRIDGKVGASRLALMGLLGLVLDGETRAVAATAAPETPSPWPDTPLTLALLERLEGQITLTAPSAALADGLELSGVVASIGLSPGRLTISSLTGNALGGRFTLRGTMEGAPAGANLTLETRLTGAQLSRLGGGDASRKLGEGNLTLALAGRATSLRAATSQMTGRGEIELRNARVEGIGAEILDKVAQAAIEGGDATGVAGLQGAIATALARSGIAAGNRKLPIEVADGIARIGILEIATPEASLRNTTTVDVAALKADSEWRITPRRPLPGGQANTRREPLPSIAVVWVGPLATVGRSEPRLSLEALEREVSIRRVERDAEKLEEERRQLEQRARAEAERQRQLEESQRPAGPRSEGASDPGTAPVIQAPFPITQGNVAVPPVPPPAPGIAPPPSGVTRPPPPRPAVKREGSKTLLDALTGNN